MRRWGAGRPGAAVARATDRRPAHSATEPWPPRLRCPGSDSRFYGTRPSWRFSGGPCFAPQDLRHRPTPRSRKRVSRFRRRRVGSLNLHVVGLECPHVRFMRARGPELAVTYAVLRMTRSYSFSGLFFGSYSLLQHRNCRKNATHSHTRKKNRSV